MGGFSLCVRQLEEVQVDQKEAVHTHMLPSVEARWFMRGAVPVEALDWIKRWDLPPTTPDEREDHYLRLPETAAIGVKLREGRCEVKRRDIDLGQAGINLKTRYASAEQIRTAVHAILTNERYRDEAQRLRTAFTCYNALDELARAVNAMLTQGSNVSKLRPELVYTS